MSARCTDVHTGGIVLSVSIHITSKDLYTMRFCRIGVCVGPTHPEKCELVVHSSRTPDFVRLVFIMINHENFDDLLMRAIC